MTVTWLDSCPSTNSVLPPEAVHGTAVAARTQTAGRGQRGNSWEAEPGRNLTFSLMLRPHAIEARNQFELSMLVALETASGIDRALAATPYRCTVKWPNDIYVGDRKICGILIENTLEGPRISRSIAGIGINVNQTTFRSDAPNPVSIAQLTGAETPLEPLLEDICLSITGAVRRYTADDRNTLLEEYRRRLWRGTGVHPFRRPGGGEFRAAIVGIDPDGTLRLSNGGAYAFKEVAFVLPQNPS